MSLIDPHFAQVTKDYPSVDLHEELGIDWLGVTRAKNTCIDIFKDVNKLGPPGIVNDIDYYVPARELRSRNQSCIIRPKLNTKFAENDL